MASNFVPDIENTYVAKDPDFHYWFPAVGTTVHLYTNTTKAPFDDPNVRKALSMAIDRDQIVAVAMYDTPTPPMAPVSMMRTTPGAAKRPSRRAPSG